MSTVSGGSLFNCFDRSGFWETPADKIAFNSLTLDYDFIRDKYSSGDDVMGYLGYFDNLHKMVEHADTIIQMGREKEPKMYGRVILGVTLKDELDTIGSHLCNIAFRVQECVVALEQCKAAKEKENVRFPAWRDKQCEKIQRKINNFSQFSEKLKAKGWKLCGM